MPPTAKKSRKPSRFRTRNLDTLNRNHRPASMVAGQSGRCRHGHNDQRPVVKTAAWVKATFRALSAQTEYRPLTLDPPALPKLVDSMTEKIDKITIKINP
ncbi:hypothetical protein PO124_25285 [Bacillus licheniformis]|nr:hypothetical protein [Bacillus licheniformis]